MTKKSINLVQSFTSAGLTQNKPKSKNRRKHENNEISPNNGENDTPSINYFQLFRYATTSERLATIFGLILCSLGAIGIPISTIMYGEFTSLLIDRTTLIGTSTKTTILEFFGGGKILTNASKEENQNALIKDSEAFAIASAVLFIIQFVMVAIGIDIINRQSLHQINRIRLLFLQALLRQDMAWYDTVSTNNFASKITDNLEKIKEAISEKLGVFFFLVMSFIISIIFSFFYGWKLTLVVMSCAPFIILSVAIVTKIETSLAEKELKSYSIAGSVAEEVLSGIRTVVAFSGEKKEIKRYSEQLKPAEENGNRKGLYCGLGGGFMWFIIYCCYALALWYGIKLILEDRDKIDGEYTPAVLVIVLFGVLVGAENLGFTSPHIEAFSSGCGAAKSIFSIIDRKPLIDSLDKNGLQPENVIGRIKFDNVTFKYPARDHVPVLKGISFNVDPGQTVALVGPSGCGKSTCLQLLQRLYDPLSGNVQLDGVKIKELNTAWLRSKIGVVGQEPVLFATTIGENIRYGKTNATQEEIEEAAKLANCHSFIKKLPKGYDTMVGERGAQLSGGQKQRIAIARALIRNPPILLLDEATSALDPTSERRVQDALEEASKGRTTLVVSHRLSSITNSDKIIFIQNGVVAEEGTHEELMEKKGLYHSLVKTTIKKETVEGKGQKELRKRPIARVMSETDPSELSSSNDSINESSQKKDKYKVSMLTLLKLNAPEWKLILVGVLASVLNGASLPMFAILFGEFYGILSIEDKNEVSEQSKIFSYYFIGLGLIAGLGTLLQTHMFNLAGSRLTSRLRQMSFKSMLSQEMAWFDDEKNSTGALCSRLSGDCAKVQGGTGSRIGVIVQSISTLVVGMIISFYYSWNLTLVTLITVPIVLGSVYLESRYMDFSDKDEKQAIENSSQIAVEAISNIRTVASLGQETHVLKRYCIEIQNCLDACRKKIRFRGSVFSLGQTTPSLAYGIGLYYGGYLVATTDLEYKNVIKVSEALIFGAWILGAALAYAPNLNSATSSAGRILKLLKRTPKIHNPPQLPYNTADKIDGDISYEHVEFRYPKRPEVTVLQGLNLDIAKGSTVALVGPSGCGKSTCIQLLLRYYDPDEGTINLTGTPTTEFPFDMLRSQLGLVSQEPVLFDRTIAENIAYGDNFREASMHEIIEAAKKANIHDFIMGLPSGYDTYLGSKGAQLSGGQKQRIAIARALVRNPRILILDEATSALDMQSEKIVQEALDAARHGRTCITIAHRLTTIQNADLICVIKNGTIVEKGAHDELMEMNGIYASLYTMQQIA